MRVTLHPIELNPKDQFESDFIEWYEQNHDKTRDLLLSGFFFIKNGLSAYYEEHYKSDADRIWRSKYETLNTRFNEAQSRAFEEEDQYSLRLEKSIKEYQQRLQDQQAEFTSYKNSCTSAYALLQQQIQDQYTNKHTQELSLLKQQYETRMQSEMHQLRQDLSSQLSDKQHQLSRLEQQYETQLQQQQLDLMQQLASTKQQLSSSQESYQQRLSYEQLLIRQETEKYKALYDQLATERRDEQLEQLHKRILEREQELAQLKRTNCGKGVLGENMIMNQLRSLFPSAEISDTSKMKQSTDIHMRLDKQLYAFESKYKETITPQDIEKFYRDIEQVALLNGDQFMGAAFVSLKTKNIPNKGDLHFDTIQNRPVLFIGFDEELDSHLFDSMVRLLLKISQYHQSRANQTSTLQELIEKLRPIYSTISRTRTDIESIKQMASKIIDSTINLDRDITKSITSLHSIVGDQATQDPNTCPGCSKQFQNLKVHMRACKLLKA